jgi:hypothetical protein
MSDFVPDEGVYARYLNYYHRAWVKHKVDHNHYHVILQDFGEETVVHVSKLKKISTVSEAMYKLLAPEDRQYIWPAVCYFRT